MILVLLAPQATAGRFTLLFSADVSGETEPCGCAVEPLGGLARAASVVASARGQSAQPDAVLYLDAGNLLASALETGSTSSSPAHLLARKRAEMVASAMTHMGLAGFLPGPGDWSLEPGATRRLLDRAGLVAIASNARSRDSDRGVKREGPASSPASSWKPDLLVTAGGVKVGVIGLVEARPQDEARLKAWGATFDEPGLVAQERVARLRARGAEVIIALLDVGKLPAVRAFLREVHGLDFAIAAGTGTRLDPPEQVGDTVLLGAMPLGREVGWVDLEVRVPGRPFVDRRARERLSARLADHERQQQDLAGEAVDPQARHRRAALERVLAEERAALARPTEPSPNNFDAKLIALDASWPDEPFVADLLARGSTRGSLPASSHRPDASRAPARTPRPK
jgi:2',3'-cyclic-nucleotide 2'-phosphodiesterase (5'-nucleotidase family)